MLDKLLQGPGQVNVLSAGVDRPCHLEWKDSEVSKINLGADFDLIIQIFEEVKHQDEKYGWVDKFTCDLTWF